MFNRLRCSHKCYFPFVIIAVLSLLSLSGLK
jgi:hypothetical protein